jgi:hypothetical protein
MDIEKQTVGGGMQTGKKIRLNRNGTTKNGGELKPPPRGLVKKHKDPLVYNRGYKEKKRGPFVVQRKEI